MCKLQIDVVHYNAIIYVRIYVLICCKASMGLFTRHKLVC
jgi:hypothetical protein